MIMRLNRAIFVFGCLLAAGLAAPAQASVVYTLDFDSSNGATVEGTGTLTLNFSSLSQANNLNESLAGILGNLTTTSIDGSGPFTITPSNLASGSQFQTGNVGQIYTLTIAEAGSGSSSVLFLDLYTNTWQLHGGYDNGPTEANGKLVVSGPSVSATPLPSALPLFASGLALLGYLFLRRKGSAASQAPVAALS
jgi:hypothetical protein